MGRGISGVAFRVVSAEQTERDRVRALLTGGTDVYVTGGDLNGDSVEWVCGSPTSYLREYLERTAGRDLPPMVRAALVALVKEQETADR